MNEKKANRIINQILMYLDASNITLIECMAIVSSIAASVMAEIATGEDMGEKEYGKMIDDFTATLNASARKLVEDYRDEDAARRRTADC